MGKAANNEKIKLRAMFYNNIAVTFVLTGVVVPLFTVLYTEELRNMSLTKVVVHSMFWPVLVTIGCHSS
jgi:hypothetical protein